jgi:hypothetical protein
MCRHKPPSNIKIDLTAKVKMKINGKKKREEIKRIHY